MVEANVFQVLLRAAKTKTAHKKLRAAFLKKYFMVYQI